MSVTATARSLLRSSATRATRLSSIPRTKPNVSPSFSPFPISNKQTPLSLRILRSPVELSSCVETMLPYHSVTAAALLTSMLSVSRRTYGWTAEDCIDDV